MEIVVDKGLAEGGGGREADDAIGIGYVGPYNRNRRGSGWQTAG